MKAINEHYLLYMDMQPLGDNKEHVRPISIAADSVVPLIWVWLQVDCDQHHPATAARHHQPHFLQSASVVDLQTGKTILAVKNDGDLTQRTAVYMEVAPGIQLSDLGPQYVNIEHRLNESGDRIIPLFDCDDQSGRLFPTRDLTRLFFATLKELFTPGAPLSGLPYSTTFIGRQLDESYISETGLGQPAVKEAHYFETDTEALLKLLLPAPKAMSMENAVESGLPRNYLASYAEDNSAGGQFIAHGIVVGPELQYKDAQNDHDVSYIIAFEKPFFHLAAAHDIPLRAGESENVGLFVALSWNSQQPEKANTPAEHDKLVSALKETQIDYAYPLQSVTNFYLPEREGAIARIEEEILHSPDIMLHLSHVLSSGVRLFVAEKEPKDIGDIQIIRHIGITDGDQRLLDIRLRQGDTPTDSDGVYLEISQQLLRNPNYNFSLLTPPGSNIDFDNKDLVSFQVATFQDGELVPTPVFRRLQTEIVGAFMVSQMVNDPQILKELPAIDPFNDHFVIQYQWQLTPKDGHASEFFSFFQGARQPETAVQQMQFAYQWQPDTSDRNVPLQLYDVSLLDGKTKQPLIVISFDEAGNAPVAELMPEASLRIQQALSIITNATSLDKQHRKPRQNPPKSGMRAPGT